MNMNLTDSKFKTKFYSQELFSDKGDLLINVKDKTFPELSSRLPFFHPSLFLSGSTITGIVVNAIDNYTM